MLTRYALGAAALVAALTLGAPAAQAQSPIKLGLAGGVALPIGNGARDLNNSGYNGTVTVALNAPLVPIGLRLDGMFNELQGKELLANIDAPDMSVSSVNANLTYNLLPLPVARVYLIGGAGYYRTEFKGTGVDPDWNVGYNGGVGIRIGVGRTQAFVEGRYHRVSLGNDRKVELVPVTVGFLF